ncbi:TPA: hypothetical protein DDW35_07140 [Candidatus Sumerlaeota bacterium]|jgi:hypothetical protein|nr:hypothetical protein [Candidatus Sumerlaeota bacterium]
MKGILFVIFFLSATVASSALGIRWIVSHYTEDGPGGDPLTYIRERQRIMEVGRFYCVEYGSVVQLIQVTDGGYDAKFVFDVAAVNNTPEHVISYNKMGWAIAPNNPDWDILRPVGEGRQKGSVSYPQIR